MLKRPSSSRRSGGSAAIHLNLVPMLDALVTLIAFLLFSLSLIAYVGVESPAPTASPDQLNQPVKELPLQLTLTLSENYSELWSPFDKIPVARFDNNEEGKPDLDAIHEALIQIKSNFPSENKIFLMPNAGMNYESLVSVMDAVRVLKADDPIIYASDEATGVEKEIELLFPEVVFGNLISQRGNQ